MGWYKIDRNRRGNGKRMWLKHTLSNKLAPNIPARFSVAAAPSTSTAELFRNQIGPAQASFAFPTTGGAHVNVRQEGKNGWFYEAKVALPFDL